MRRILPLLLLCGACLLAGCQKSQVTTGGVANPRPVESIISLSPSATDLIVRIGASGNLKGRMAADDNGVAKRIDVIGSVKPDYEKIAEIKPDLVVYDADLYSASDVEKIKQLGAQTFAIDATTVVGFIDQIDKLGQIVGHESDASDLADQIFQAKAAAQGDKITPVPTVAMVMSGGGGSDMILGTTSFLADALRAAGGNPVGPSAERFVQLNPEEFVKLNPDFILVAGDPAGVAHDPRFSAINAVKNGHVFTLKDQDTVLRRGPTIADFISKVHQVLGSKS